MGYIHGAQPVVPNPPFPYPYFLLDISKPFTIIDLVFQKGYPERNGQRAGHWYHRSWVQRPLTTNVTIKSIYPTKCLLIIPQFDGPDAEEFKREAGGAEQGPHAIPENPAIPD